MSENKKVAFIILRHGQDFRKKPPTPESELWEYSCEEHNEDGAATCSKKDRWNYYFKDPKSEKVQLRVRRLNAEGREQAQQLAKALPKWLDENNYFPIRRVEVKDPRQPTGTERRTQNPFQTVYPLVYALEKNGDENYVRFKLMDNGFPDNELTYDALKDKRGNYSTVVCWDCQGLWGDKVDGEWPAKAANGSILKRLIPNQLDDLKHEPKKCKDLYIVIYDDEKNEFKLDAHIQLPDIL